MKPATTTALMLALLLPAHARAQAPTAMDFARHPEVYEVALSPDGKNVALAVPAPDGMETMLQIVPLDGSGKTQVLRFGKQQHVTDIHWSDDARVVVARAKMEPLRARPYSLGELFSSDINGKNQRTLFAYVPGSGAQAAGRKDRGFATVVGIVDHEPGKVLVDFTAWPESIGDETLTSSVYKVDAGSGNRQEIEQTKQTASFSFDGRGRARLRTTTDGNDNPVLMYRPGAGEQWLPVPKSIAGYGMDLLHVEADDNTAYATITDGGEPAQLYKIDLAKGARIRIAGRDDLSISTVLFAGRNGSPFGVVCEGAKPSIQYFDPASEWAQLHASLMKAFPGQLVSLLDFTRDNGKVLIQTRGDRHPGAWHVYDRNARKLVLINEAMPWLKPEKLAPSMPFSFRSRDGLTLHGFLTAHPGGGQRPMVVMPHGGPHGYYDTWSYDGDAQFLASRGYAVLQVNFRGSGGRGRGFMESGYREWGGRMQDDIADAVAWATTSGHADPARICTFGASYGGYAALMQPIRFPETYRCAIGYVGVYDLQVMKKEGDISDRQSGRRYLERVLGSDQAQLKAWSPAQNVDRIKVPVLLAQGSIDRRVPMDQFNALRKAFEKAGTPIETMVVQGEGHGFYKPENRAELYERIEAFLARNIGAAAK